jgi:hypothetical protein
MIEVTHSRSQFSFDLKVLMITPITLMMTRSFLCSQVGTIKYPKHMFGCVLATSPTYLQSFIFQAKESSVIIK